MRDEHFTLAVIGSVLAAGLVISVPLLRAYDDRHPSGNTPKGKFADCMRETTSGAKGFKLDTETLTVNMEPTIDGGAFVTRSYVKPLNSPAAPYIVDETRDFKTEQFGETTAGTKVFGRQKIEEKDFSVPERATASAISACANLAF